MKMIEAKKVVPLIRLILLDNPNIEKICKGIQDVVNIHTIEAEPVRHGRWIDAYPDIEPNPMFMYGICSECGFEQGISKYLNYCPNCGAKMESECG